MNIQLRSYQQEIVDMIDNIDTCRWLIQLPTGCGKTVTFSQLKFNRMLIISHREELVNQPKKYFNCSYGVEMAKFKSNGEKVVSTCIQSLVRRLDKFNPEDFDVIVIDEAHHSAAKSYRKVIDYFKPQKLLGFTATPNRNDGIRLNDIFDKIAYKMNLKDAIKNGYLTDIECIRSYLDYDLTQCRKNSTDYNLEDLSECMEDTAKGISKVYKEKAKGQTLMFGVSVKHCEDIAKEIPNSVVVSATTKNREQIIKDFTNKKFNCLINCMIFTEGTDIPLIETVIIARPTMNESLYSQMVGRGLRLYDGKDKLRLIDCVGVSNNLNLCTAPSLIGLKYDDGKVKEKTLEVESLFDLPEIISKKMDTIDYWKCNYKYVDIWAKKAGYNTHGINFYQLPNGDFTLKLPTEKLIKIKYPDELGLSNKNKYIQEIFDDCYLFLEKNHDDLRYLWDLQIIKRWGNKPATDKQIEMIEKYTREKVIGNLNKLEASQILNRLFNK